VTRRIKEQDLSGSSKTQCDFVLQLRRRIIRSALRLPHSNVSSGKVRYFSELVGSDRGW
jgi:hypothetical protein